MPRSNAELARLLREQDSPSALLERLKRLDQIRSRWDRKADFYTSAPVLETELRVLAENTPPEERAIAIEAMRRAAKRNEPQKKAGFLGRTLGGYVAGWERMQEAKAPYLGMGKTLEPDQIRFRQMLKAAIEDSDPRIRPETPLVGKFFQQAAEMTEPMIEAIAASKGVMAGTGAAPGTWAGWAAETAGVSGSFYPLMAEQSYESMIGERIDPEVAKVASRISGGVQGLLESILPDPTKGLSEAAKGSLRQITAKVFKQALINYGKEWSEEGLQGFADQLTTEYARYFDETSEFKGNAEAFKSATKRAIADLKDSAGPLAIMMAPGGARMGLEGIAAIRQKVDEGGQVSRSEADMLGMSKKAKRNGYTRTKAFIRGDFEAKEPISVRTVQAPVEEVVGGDQLGAGDQAAVVQPPPVVSPAPVVAPEQTALGAVEPGADQVGEPEGQGLPSGPQKPPALGAQPEGRAGVGPRKWHIDPEKPWKVINERSGRIWGQFRSEKEAVDHAEELSGTMPTRVQRYTGTEPIIPQTEKEPTDVQQPEVKGTEEPTEQAAPQAETQAAEVEPDYSLRGRRERAHAEGLGTRYWTESKKQSRKIKGQKGDVGIMVDVDDKGKELKKPRRKTVKGEILNEDWAITPSQQEGGKHVLTHIPTGLAAIHGKPNELRHFLQLAEDAGVNLMGWGDKLKEISGDALAAIRQIKKAWDMNTIPQPTEETEGGPKPFPDEFRKAMYGTVQTAEPGIEADVVLDSYDLGVHEGRGLTDAGAKAVKRLAREVPEFGYDPIFHVEDGPDGLRLVYRDGYKFSFHPEMFNVDASELKPGQTVGINLPDLGVKRKNQTDVVKGALKNAGFVKIGQKKGGKIVTGQQRGKTVEVSQLGTEETPQWSVTSEGSPEVGTAATQAVQAIRWKQPGEGEGRAGGERSFAERLMDDYQIDYRPAGWAEDEAPTWVHSPNQGHPSRRTVEEVAEITGEPLDTLREYAEDQQRRWKEHVGKYGWTRGTAEKPKKQRRKKKEPDTWGEVIHGMAMPEGGQQGPTDFDRGPVPPAQEEADAAKMARTAAQPMPLPEMIQIVKELLGSPPAVQILRRYLGYFRHHQDTPKWATMVINAIAAKDEVLLAKVLAHEAGHLIDWIPNWTTARGNILGRIASLRGHTKTFMAGMKGGQEPLTKAEEKRLRREAKRLSEPGAYVWVEEEITDRFEITPQDILNIWNSLTEEVPADLLRYIKRLSAAEKLSIVKEAMRGVVPEELQQFAKVIKRKTGRRTRQRVETPASKADIEAKFKELLNEEIKKRMLLSEETIRNELIRLSEWWFPYNKRTASRGYIAERRKPSELYADAISVFLNAPAELVKRAPEFYRGFSSYLGEKPQVAASFFHVQAVLNGGAEAVSAAREAIRHEMFKEGEAAIVRLQAEIERARKTTPGRIYGALMQYIIDRTHPIKQRAKKSSRDKAQAAAAAMEELAYSENRSYVMLRDIEEQIWQPLQAEGLGTDEIGDYLLMRRVIDERNEIANPLGYTPIESAKEIEALKAKIGEEKYALLDQKMQEWHDIIFQSAIAAVDSGVYSQDAFEQSIIPKKDSYATFWVIKHIEGEIDPELHAQIGTFEGIANPWDATIMKMIKLNRLVELNNAKNAVRSFLRSDPQFAHEITRIEEKGRMPKPGFKALHILENGRTVTYHVPAEIANSFKRHNIGGLAYAGNAIQTPVYAVFHRLFVTYSPGFIAANPMRDLERTWVNLGSIGGKWNRELRRALVAKGMSPAEAKKAASKQNITAGQVIYAFMKARSVATAHLTGTEDPVMRQLMEQRAMSVPYVEVSAEIGESTSARRLMQQYGITEAERRDLAKVVPGLRTILDTIKLEGARQEVAGKLAAWNLITERMEAARKLGIDLISEKERARVVRRYAGTPDFKQRGLATSITNGLWMYSNVMFQGLTADLELATNPKTAAGWWWRRVLKDIVPTTLSKAALYGGFGAAAQAVLMVMGGDDDDKKRVKKTTDKMQDWARRIPSYYLANYDVVPIGVTIGKGRDAKALFVKFPKDEVGRAISKVYGALIDATMEAAGIDTPGMSVEKNLMQAVEGAGSAGEPTLNPIAQMAWAWWQYSKGNNPNDSFYGEAIVPERTFEAGGWPATRKMLAWTENKFGALGQLTHFATGAWTGRVFDPSDEWTVERAINLPTGLNRYIGLSNKGLSEKEWAAVQEKENESERFKERWIPTSVRRMTTQYYLLSQSDDVDTDPELSVRAFYHKRWYYDVYRPYLDAMKQESEPDKLRLMANELERITDIYRQGMQAALKDQGD